MYYIHFSHSILFTDSEKTTHTHITQQSFLFMRHLSSFLVLSQSAIKKIHSVNKSFKVSNLFIIVHCHFFLNLTNIWFEKNTYIPRSGSKLEKTDSVHITCMNLFYFIQTRGKSRGTTFLPNKQLPLIFVRLLLHALLQYE